MAQFAPRAWIASLGGDQAIMPREPGERDLQHDLAGALRPAILLLRLFETFSLQQISTSTPATSGPAAISARATCRVCSRSKTNAPRARSTAHETAPGAGVERVRARGGHGAKT
jgi:hypothetical protein